MTCIWSRAQPICAWEISGTKGESLGGQPVPRGCQHLGRVKTLCCSCHFGLLCSQGMYKPFSNCACSACRQDTPQQKGKGSTASVVSCSPHYFPSRLKCWGSAGPSRQRGGVPCRHPATWKTKMILIAAAGSSNFCS